MRRSSRGSKSRGSKWCVAFGLVLTALLLAGPASADDYVGTPPPNAGSADTGGSGSSAASSPSGAASSPSGAAAQGGSAHGGSAHGAGGRSGGLAVTGTDIVSMLFLAGVLVGTGFVLKRRAGRSVS